MQIYTPFAPHPSSHSPFFPCTNSTNNSARLFERAANSVGLDFLAHPFWDKYIEFEERLDAHDKIFAILSRIVHVPMHQYARYFERYRQMAASRPIEELAPADVLAQLSAETAFPSKGQDSDRELRARLDAYHLELFQRTQTETTKRWTYEQEVKRPYFHVTELDEAQLSNWQKYLDFEEAEGDFTRVAFLYERCLVTAAHYDDFWHRYARWMYAREGKDEEVRNIFMRASCFYVPIAKPVIRLQWALFEEVSGRPSVAAAIYEAILLALPGHLEAIVGLASLQRRQEGIEAALAVYHQQLDSPQSSTHTKGALVAEMARLAYKAHGNVEDGRRVFQDQQNAYLDSQLFWSGYLSYELEQAVSMDAETQHYQRVRAVHDDIRRKSHLAPDIVKELSHRYMAYLTERGGKGAAKEYMDLDAEINGPASAIGLMRIKNTAETKSLAGLHPGAVPNGHAAA